MIESLNQHVEATRIRQLDQLLGKRAVYTKDDFERLLRKLAKQGHAKALENYLYANRFIKREGLSIGIQDSNWKAYRTKALTQPKPARTRFRALANIPTNAGINQPTILGSIRGAMDELMRQPSDPVIVVSPFLDEDGIKFVRAAAARANEKNCRCILLTRFPVTPGQDRNGFADLLASLADTNVLVSSFHEQEPGKRFVQLSFHAKGLYMRDACVLATMNLVSANMERNVEFGIKIEGAVAQGYFEVLTQMANRRGPESIGDALADNFE